MSEPRSYPEGVTSWIDVEQGDVDGAQAFYGGLFGWTFTDATPPAAATRYLVAHLDGLDSAGLAEAGGGDGPAAAAWRTYVAVDDADAAAARVSAAGGKVLEAPADVGDAGRSVGCADPFGVPFRLWQPRHRLGVQVVNAPGSWNFSDLHAADPGASAAFYAEVFGWSFDDVFGFATMIRVPGYGDHLAATSDPDIHARQSGAEVPTGFADAIGWLATASPDDQPHWHVSFAVANRDATAALAERLGGTVLERRDTDWTLEAVIRDPQGAVFTASQYNPVSA